MVVAGATSSNYSAHEDNIGEKKAAIHVSINIHTILSKLHFHHSHRNFEVMLPINTFFMQKQM